MRCSPVHINIAELGPLTDKTPESSFDSRLFQIKGKIKRHNSSTWMEHNWFFKYNPGSSPSLYQRRAAEGKRAGNRACASGRAPGPVLPQPLVSHGNNPVAAAEPREGTLGTTRAPETCRHRCCVPRMGRGFLSPGHRPT